MIYTDEELSRLIDCKKRVSQAPRREMRVDGQMLRNEMDLESTDGKHVFHVFMRQSQVFSENFSVGMEYVPKDEPGKFCLMRYNGKHGGHKVHPHHLECHIHQSKAEDVNEGLRVERCVTKTDEYAAFQDALRQFLRAVNVEAADVLQHFSYLTQGDLFDQEAER